MFQRILVPLDGTQNSERAIPVALRIAQASNAGIVFLRVILPMIEPGAYTTKASGVLEPEAFVKERQDANDYLDDLLHIHAKELQHIATEGKVIAGAVSPSIFSVAQMEGVDLIVMCSHGETGLKRWVFGSVAHETVRHSPVPVLILHEHGVIPATRDATHPFRILVALDGSPLAEAALEPAARLCAALAAPSPGALHLMRLVDMPTFYGGSSSDTLRSSDSWRQAETYLEGVAHRLQESELSRLNVTVTWSVELKRDADTAETIVEVAEQVDENGNSQLCNIIAMATHGRTGLQHILLGSVAERVRNTTRQPLFIVHLSPSSESIHREAETGHRN